ncbi:hypothetical protein CHUAL_011331 [Chamberlinius hualienensis]
MCSKTFIVFLMFTFYAQIKSIKVEELLKEEFQLFQQEHGRNYRSKTEYDFRLQNYLENKLMIALHNQKFHRGLSEYSMEINQFADRSNEELMSRTTDYSENTELSYAQLPNILNKNVPDEIDWRKYPGYVNPVRNQGDCKSAWAFSYAGSIEGRYGWARNKSLKMSAQEFIDCSEYGCASNFNRKVIEHFDGFMFLNGIASDTNYPYVGKAGECEYSPDMRVGTLITREVWEPSEIGLHNAIGQYGPHFAALDGQQKAFIFYKKGIYSSDDCKTGLHEMNHSVVIVGFGKDKASGREFWILKNSWGTKWGEDGYMRLAKNECNQCGIANFTFFPDMKFKK